MRTAFINANVITIDPKHPKAEAFLVDGDKFALVGSREEILAAAGDAQVVDLAGKTIVPGFNDSHLHLLNFAYSRTKINLYGTTSIAEIQEKSRAWLAERKPAPGTWVSAAGWNQYSFQEGRLLNRSDLDAISTDYPMIFTRVCEHTVAVNSKALELIGIDDSTPDPESGEIERDADGHATGILKETARYLAYAKVPDKSVADIKEMLLDAIDYVSKLGITSVQTDDFETFSSKNWHNVIQAYQELEKEGKLKVRVYEQCLLPQIDRFKEFLAAGYKTGVGTDMFKIGPLKLLTDGSIGPRTAYLAQPYSDDPGNRGISVFTQDELDELVGTAQANGMQVVCHGIGDAAMTMILNAYEKAQKEHPREDARNGIIHVQITTKEIMDRMLRDHVVAYGEPVCVGADMHCVEDRVGKERMKESYAYRTMNEMGLRVPLSSDCPVDSVNPIDSAYIAVNRKDLNGWPEGGWYPEERLTIDQVLKGFTLDSAYAQFQEDVKGSIEAGKYADFVVLSGDPTAIDPNDLRSIRAEGTYLGGQKVN